MALVFVVFFCSELGEGGAAVGSGAERLPARDARCARAGAFADGTAGADAESAGSIGRLDACESVVADGAAFAGRTSEIARGSEVVSLPA